MYMYRNRKNRKNQKTAPGFFLRAGILDYSCQPTSPESGHVTIAYFILLIPVQQQLGIFVFVVDGRLTI